MNISNLFLTQKDKNEAISMLKGLGEMQYWKFFCGKVLDPIIHDLSEQILDPESDGDMTNLKLQRKYLVMLKNLPNQAVESLQEQDNNFFEADPYFKEVREIKEFKRKK